MIETERLVLRPWREADKPAFAALFNTAGVMRWLGGVKSRTECDALIDKRIADQARDGFCYWAVERRADGVLVGSAGLRRGLNYGGTPVEGLHEIGWRVAEPYWRQGYAREAITGAIDWAWRAIDAPLIAAWTTIENEPSWRLMERIGMMRRPELDFRRRDDLTVPLIVYTLDRPAA